MGRPHCEADGGRPLTIPSERGPIETILHGDPAAGAAAILVGGYPGGFDGPAEQLYPDLAEHLARAGIAALRLHYRVITMPGNVEESSYDVQAACRWLGEAGAARIGLVGHSFGGAVVIDAGARVEAVRAVVALSTQNAGTEMAPFVAPAALLLIHGLADDRLPPACSVDVYNRAAQPKEIRLLEGATHSLRQERGAVLHGVYDYLQTHLLQDA